MAEKTKDEIIDELRQQVGALEVELKNTERLARDTKRHFARLIDSSTDAIISADKEGRIVLLIEGAKILLGYQAEEVIGGRMSTGTGRDYAQSLSHDYGYYH